MSIQIPFQSTFIYLFNAIFLSNDAALKRSSFWRFPFSILAYISSCKLIKVTAYEARQPA